MVFAIHWHESAMDLHVFPILSPPPTSLPITPLWVILVGKKENKKIKKNTPGPHFLL